MDSGSGQGHNSGFSFGPGSGSLSGKASVLDSGWGLVHARGSFL